MSKLGAPDRKVFEAFANWFGLTHRILPWRDEPTLYRVWISEIMLQQTQVATVVPYFERFVARFPSVEALAAAPESDVVHAWAGLGYYSRARNLHKGAQKIVAAGGIQNFKSREAWLEVPGVGPYTAGAITSIALGAPEAILDGNVERVLARVLQLDRAALGDATYKAQLWEASGRWVAQAYDWGVSPRVFNQALMELGATICNPRAPRCGLCPLAPICGASRTEHPARLPTRKAPKKWIEIQEARDCWMDSRGRVLVEQAATGQWRAGLWDLPESREQSPEGARARAGQSISKPPGKWERAGEVVTRHVVTRHKITRKTTLWRPSSKKLGAAQPPALANAQIRWVDPKTPEVGVGSAFNKTLQALYETHLESN